MKPLVALIIAVLSPLAVLGQQMKIPLEEKQAHAVAQLHTIALCCLAYAIDHGGDYPEAKNLRELSVLVQPVYVQNLPSFDIWGNDIDFTSNRKTFTVRSVGADGSRDPVDQLTETSDPAADIINVDGEFVQYPAGIEPPKIHHPT